jgi:programmed cell death protein 4
MSVEVEPMQPEVNGLVEEDGDLRTAQSALFGEESAENAPVKEGRIIRRAKRPSKASPMKEDGTVSMQNLPSGINKPYLPFSKNSKKSRNARGRGLPKKGGAGGKGVWGAPGSELGVTAEPSDVNDPNYDSDSQDIYVVEKVEPALSADEIPKTVEPIIQEYFEHGDSEEVLESLCELNFGRNRHKLPGVAISLALDRHDPQRELTSRLISDMYGNFLDQEEMAKGFDELLGTLADLTIDSPEAPNLVGQFIARAVADDCLPPKYVKSFKGKVECSYSQQALDKADVLLSMSHGIVRLDNVWGVGGGNRPVKYLIKRICLLLKEYVSSGDIQEAVRCVKELDVPHFHHEIVYEALMLAIEDTTERTGDMMVELLKYMTNTNIVTVDQMKKGMSRIIDNMPDICLDVPAAYGILERVGNKMYAEGILPESIYKDLPARGRKRFVSEGDGGRVKESNGH